MIEDVLRGLADELSSGGPGGGEVGLRLRQGVAVTVPGDGTATVTIGGDSTLISGVRVASHVPLSAGQTCWILTDGQDLFVVATLAMPPIPMPFRMAAGANRNSAIVGPGAGVTVAITFPAGRFTHPPRVVVTSADSSRLNVATNNVTTAGCNVRLDNFTAANAASRDFDWIAIQMLPGGASG